MEDVKLIHTDRAMINLSEAVAKRMKDNAPEDTGALKKSIKVLPAIETPSGIDTPISMLIYGIYQNAPGFAHTGWLDESIEITNAEVASIQEAYQKDLEQYVDDNIPDVIEVEFD